MGMDIYGNAPTTRDGEYWQGSVWTWGDVLHAIKRVNRENSLGFDLTGWEWNDGAGLDNQSDCDTLALALEAALDSPHPPAADGAPLPQAAALMRALAPLQAKVVSPRAAEEDARLTRRINDFIRFLRHCGGFQIT